MAADSCAEFRDLVVFGGGCYGRWYVGQLAAARARGRTRWRRLLVVDRLAGCAAAPSVGRTPDAMLVAEEWPAFLGRFLADGDRADGDMFVPSPLMPHLFADWLAAHLHAAHPARVVHRNAGPSCGTPFDRLGRDGVRYVSHADWLCPVNCIEPHRCPATRAPRTWEMADTVSAAAGDATVVLLECRHQVFGVGMVPVTALLAAAERLDLVARRPEGGTAVIASLSACHGAVATLTVGAA